jgi:hypothetical protein
MVRVRRFTDVRVRLGYAPRREDEGQLSALEARDRYLGLEKSRMNETAARFAPGFQHLDCVSPALKLVNGKT